MAFNSSSDDLVSPSYGPDFTHVFLRGVASGCAVGFDAGGGGPGGPGGPGGGGGPKRDTTPPRISGARVTHARFSVAGARTALLATVHTGHHAQAPRGTSFVFSLSERAATTIAITRLADGRRSGRRCVAPRRGLKRRCTRTIAVLTLIRERTAAGRNSVVFSGRAGRTTLKAGRYVAQIVARDGAGNRSRPVNLAFTVVAP